MWGGVAKETEARDPNHPHTFTSVKEVQNEIATRLVNAKGHPLIRGGAELGEEILPVALKPV